MSLRRRFAWSALAVGLIGGIFTASTTPRRSPERVGDEFVLEADFHVHTLLCDGLNSPLGIVAHANRHGLDAIAVTNHNQILAARIARWFSGLVDGPLVLVGQEITAPEWHLIGAGMTGGVDWRQPLHEAIAAVQAQGGVAIAAHPSAKYHDDYDDQARALLDGTEIGVRRRPAKVEFYELVRSFGVAAIGSSDHHFFDALGSVRTYVFAESRTEEALLEAIRRGRTVVIDEQGRTFGDPQRIDALLPLLEPDLPARDPWRILFGLLGLSGVALLAGPPLFRRSG